MNKSQLVDWLQQEDREWRALLDRIGAARMEQPGVNGEWSMKNLVAHLTGWNRNLLVRLQAAARGEVQPPPPWPIHLRTDDEINTWNYGSYRGRSLSNVLAETEQVFREILAVVQEFPEDVRIEHVHRAGRVYHLVWLGDERHQPAEFFEHFHDDHEPDVRAWLARAENQ